MKKHITFILIITCMFLLTSCDLRNGKSVNNEKQMVFGTTLSTKVLDPANGYCGWFLLRYGVGETLFKLDENMEVMPWLSKGYEYLDSKTVKIDLNDNIKFHNGKVMSAEDVKLSLERVINLNSRAKTTLKIKDISVENNSVIIKTEEENPTLINDLCDPFAAIIDVNEENIDTKPCGTGPFKVGEFNHTGSSVFVKNIDYWNGDVKLDSIKVMPITDSDVLAMALQSGEIDAAQGLSYSMVDMFSQDEDYKISTVDTSRAVIMYFNEKNEALKNINVRKAINSIINTNKEIYCTSILKNQASAALSMFPLNTNYALKEEEETLTKEEARKLLIDEGYENLKLNLVTYSSRAELTNIAQAIQNDLKEIGVEINIKIQDNIDEILSSGEFDLSLYSNITSSTGDAAVYLNNAVRTNGNSNYGNYSNKLVDDLLNKMNVEFSKEIRNELAIEVQKLVLEDKSYNFIAHMKMSFVMKNNVVALTPHATDYYQFNADTDME